MQTRFHVAVLAIALVAGSAHAAPPSFTIIPGLPGDNPLGTLPRGISGDGKVVVGEVRTSGQWEAMVWTRDGGTKALGAGAALAASYDGSVLAGSKGRWTQATGWQALPRPEGAKDNFIGSDISNDGSTITGTMRASDSWNQGATWSQATGSVWVPRVPGFAGASANVISGDGKIVAGDTMGSSVRGWRFDGTSSATFDARASNVRGMTPDGTTLVGSRAISLFAGYIFSPALGFYEIPNAPGLSGGYAADVSADGRTVVGTNSVESHAWIWTANDGTRVLQDVLEEKGVNFNGFTLTYCTGISDDGSTIVGIAENDRGIEQGFVVVIPAPATSMGFAALIAIARRRR